MFLFWGSLSNHFYDKNYFVHEYYLDQLFIIIQIILVLGSYFHSQQLWLSVVRRLHYKHPVQYNMVPTVKEILFSRTKLPFSRLQDLKVINWDMREKQYIYSRYDWLLRSLWYSLFLTHSIYLIYPLLFKFKLTLDIMYNMCIHRTGELILFVLKECWMKRTDLFPVS